MLRSAPCSSSARPSTCSHKVLLTTLLVFGATAAAHAQKGCGTGRISAISIDNHSIFEAAKPGIDKRFSFAYRTANRLHARTRRRVIQRELLFSVGDCYDPYMLEESERLLRATDYVSRADISGIPQPDGSYHVVVETRDQWSTELDLRVGFDRGIKLDGFRIRESNLAGSGQQASFFYIDRDVTRDYGVSYGTPQLAGTRWDFQSAAGRTRAGTFVAETFAYPFVGEVGRWGARQSFSREDQYFDYIAVDSTREFTRHLLLPVREKLFDVAVATRFGRRGNLTILGAILSYQELTYPGVIERANGSNFSERTAVDTASANAIRAQMQPLGSIRLGMVIGQRNVWWVKKRALDSMRGEEDVPLGADASFTFGRSLSAFERDNDLAGTFRLFTALDAGTALFSARARLDGRRDFNAAPAAPEWEDIYGEAELLNYWRPPALPRHTLFLRVAGAGAWNTRTPFQLTLGGDRYLRGYRPERFPGGRRVVFNAEDRIYIGWPFRDVLDIGATVFVDAGRMWPGDVPFGYDSGWLATGGLGLRGSFPAGGRSSFRIDVAAPLDNKLKNIRLIFSARELLGLVRANGSDVQLLRSRNEGVAGVFFRDGPR